MPSLGLSKGTTQASWSFFRSPPHSEFCSAVSGGAKEPIMVPMQVVTMVIYIYIYWSDPPPTNSGIMDFNCNFPAKIAQQPRDQNHKQFERPNLLDTIFSDVEPKYEITLGAAYLEPDQIYSVGACRNFVG